MNKIPIHQFQTLTGGPVDPFGSMWNCGTSWNDL